MDEAKTPFAWQPLTPRGVAAFAQARCGRLWVVQFIVALAAAAIVVWFVQGAWFPTVREGLGHLPREGEIRAGRLDWRGESPALLAEGRYLALAVDLEHAGRARSPAHVEVEFGRTDAKVFGLFGYTRVGYPTGRVVGFNREAAVPWWGAWAPPILGLTAGAVLAGLLLAWTALATVYAVPLWVGAFFGDRALSLAGSWRVAGAALMPGALFLMGAIFFYGSGVLDPVKLVAAGGAHFVIGWVYAVLGVRACPRRAEAEAARKNPFGTDDKEKKEPKGNPFGGEKK